MTKNLHCFFCAKTQYSFILINWVLRERCVYVSSRDEIRGKLLKYLNMWVVLFWGHPLTNK